MVSQINKKSKTSSINSCLEHSFGKTPVSSTVKVGNKFFHISCVELLGNFRKRFLKVLLLTKKNNNSNNTRNKSFNVKKNNKKKNKSNHTVRVIISGLLQPQDNHLNECQFKFPIKPGIKATRSSNKLSIYLQIKKMYKTCILNSLKNKESKYC